MVSAAMRATTVEIPIGDDHIAGDLVLPASPGGLVLFAHGSGSSRHSPRNRAVAQSLQAQGLGTLLADLLTAEEDAVDRRTAQLRFDIHLLSQRVVALVDWARRHPDLARLRFGVFGASTGAAAALVAAAALPHEITAIVSRGGRPDLAGQSLPYVLAPTLLIVGSRDVDVIALNEQARARMRCPVSLAIIPGASHLFEEPGTLEQVAARAGTWFATHLAGDPGR